MPSTTRSALRNLFLIDPTVTFLNHGSFGACPRPVFEHFQSLQRELENQPVAFLGRRFDDEMARARDLLGTYLSTSAQNIIFVSNATTGVNTVAKSLALAPGDEILALTHGYGALHRMWQHLCAKSSASYIKHQPSLPLTTSERFIEELWQHVTARTRALFISHITSPTAITLPIAKLVERCRAQNILSIVDGAHAPGHVDVNLDELQPDFYAGNCHKWMMAPKSAAFLYVRPEHQHWVEPLVISWGDRGDQIRQFIAENEWQGTRDIAAFLSVSKCIEFMHAHDWSSVREQCHNLVEIARSGMCQITKTAPICPQNLGWYAQMYAHPLPECDGEALQKQLYENHRVEIPVMAVDGQQYIRISIQGYNSSSDVEKLLEALATELPVVS